MRTKSFSDFRRTVAADFDAVVDNNEPLIVKRRGKASLAVIPLGMYESWQAATTGGAKQPKTEGPAEG